MRDFGGRDSVGRDLPLLVACLTVALLCYALPRTWSSALVTGIRRTALSPVVALRARAERDRTSRFTLEAIEAARDSLALRLQGDSVLVHENAELRALIGLGTRLRSRWVPAEVLHQVTPTDARMLLMNAGRNVGVAVHDPVVTPEGLLGVIWEAGPRASTVMSWRHPDFRVSAYTDSGSVLGIVGPLVVGSRGQAILELRGVALRDTVPTGATVFTTGLGGVYPRGIPIGRVIDAEIDPLGYERLYRIAPFANPGAISHAIVLLAPSDSGWVKPDSAGAPPRAVDP
ncbi:MAG TPA: rod shape-determining protein MreC [Gemmatimonadales bacterium]|nr:rod shape-determining protein MreC [Gemmatimonadales bacterium]